MEGVRILIIPGEIIPDNQFFDPLLNDLEIRLTFFFSSNGGRGIPTVLVLSVNLELKSNTSYGDKVFALGSLSRTLYLAHEREGNNVFTSSSPKFSCVTIAE